MTADDEMMDQIKNAVEQAGFEILPDSALDGILEHGKELTARIDADAAAEGRRFLDEERDSEIIEMWWKDARACTSIEEAAAFATRLLRDYRHDYGTICHALSAGILAMAWGMNGEPGANGGITGFQSGFVMWGFVKRWMSLEGPARLMQYNNLLYPQYDRKFTEISKDTHNTLIDEAKRLLAGGGGVSAVRERWEMIASGSLPDFITVEASS